MKLTCARCGKRLSRKSARLIDKVVLCSTCMFAPNPFISGAIHMTTTPSEVTLKPCPFCGGEVERVMPPCSDMSEYIRHVGSASCPVEFTAFTLDEDLSAAWNTRAALTTRDEAIEEAAKVAEDHTPGKHEGTLAAHVTGVTIARAIRALKSSTPTSGEASAPPPLSEPVCANCNGQLGDLEPGRDPEELCPSCYQEDYVPTTASGAGADVERDIVRRLESVCGTLETAGGQAFAVDFHNLAADIRHVLAALASSPEQRLREALERCRDKFLHYEQLHRLKCTADGDEKADRNREMADLCSQALERNPHG